MSQAPQAAAAALPGPEVRRRGRRRRLRHALRPRRRGPGRDGAELGSAVHAVPPRRARHDPPRRHPPAADWALQVARRLRRRAARRPCPAALARGRRRPAPTSSASRTDFTACTMVPTTADGTPLCELPELADEPHAYVKLWKHHAAQPQADRINALAAQARRGLAAPLRRADLLGVGVRQGPAAARGGAGGLRRDGALRRGGRLDRLAALRPATSATPAPPATRASTRTATYPTPRVPGALHPGFDGFVSDKLDAPDRPTSATGPAGSTARGRRAGPGCPRASRSPSATSTPTSPRPPRRPSAPGQMVAIMGTSTCHVMNGDVLREVPGMCGVVDGGIIPGLWGYEAGQSGVGDIFGWFVQHRGARRAYARGGRRAAGLACTSTSPSWPPQQAGRRARPGRPRLAQRQPLGPGRPRALRPGRRR